MRTGVGASVGGVQTPGSPSATGERATQAARAVTVVAFDFEAKQLAEIALADVEASLARGRFVWLDLDAADVADARGVLADFGLTQEIADAALADEPATRCARHEDCLHITMFGYRQRNDDIALERVSVVLGERMMATVHRGPVQFLQGVRRDYRGDFLRYARSPSFLVYELWDHLIENYLAVQTTMGERVERLQAALHAPDVDDGVFARISQLGSDLLHFRKLLLPVRAVLSDLSQRRSPFISEATQRFLANMVGSVDHLLQDMLVDRDILSESLNLYMSMVSHRTNKVMKRLTVVSVVFLPLTFLVGVYGMNFEVLPELRWKFGYGYFWALVVVVVAVILTIMRRTRLM